MTTLPAEYTATDQENSALDRFRAAHRDLFRKNDARLFLHLGSVISVLIFGTLLVISVPWIFLKILIGTVNAFLWFALVNVTIHHHQTHRNAAGHRFAKKFLDLLYLIVVPNAPKRVNRYTRAHLNHHARPFHETDVDHHYGKDRYLAMVKTPWLKWLYFLELTLVGAHMPGWQDDQYMNKVPLENWNRGDYQKVKSEERKQALNTAMFQWGAFLIVLGVGADLSATKMADPSFGGKFASLGQWLQAVAWGWAYPMLLVKNWAHFLGQFQHYDERFLDPARSILQRTKTYRFPGWLNYLAGGEISGHFLHHLYPELPYYNVETARQKFLQDSELSQLFAIY